MGALIILAIIGFAVYWGVGEIKRKARRILLWEKEVIVLIASTVNMIPQGSSPQPIISAAFQNAAILLMTPLWTVWKWQL